MKKYNKNVNNLKLFELFNLKIVDLSNITLFFKRKTVYVGDYNIFDFQVKILKSYKQGSDFIALKITKICAIICPLKS